MTPIEELKRKVEELDNKFPYKKRGDVDSYSQYREGHSDALGAVIGMIEFMLDNNQEKEFAKQCFKAGMRFENDYLPNEPNFEDFYKSLEK